MYRFEQSTAQGVAGIAQLCNTTVPVNCTYWVLHDGAKEGIVAFAVVSDNNIILYFGVRPDMRGQGFGRALMDMLTSVYSKLSTAVIPGGRAEATLLGSGFQHAGDNVMRYEGV